MPNWKELKRYCERDGWELYRETDHYFFRKVMPDGSLYRTKVSKGSGEIGKDLFRQAGCKILCKRFSTKSRMALESRADSGLNPLITESHGGQNGMRAGTA